MGWSCGSPRRRSRNVFGALRHCGFCSVDSTCETTGRSETNLRLNRVRIDVDPLAVGVGANVGETKRGGSSQLLLHRKIPGYNCGNLKVGLYRFGRVNVALACGHAGTAWGLHWGRSVERDDGKQ